MHFASNLPHPRRSLAIPLMAAAVLGAGIATATFALVNIEDEPIVSLPTPAVESAAVPSDAAAVGIPSPAAAAKMNVEAGSGTASKDEARTAAAVGIPSPAAAAKMNEQPDTTISGGPTPFSGAHP